jgi:TPR repeat protein
MNLISYADELENGNLALTKKDYADAIFWYNAAAKKNNFSAYHNLGIMYLNGTGVVQDYVKAYAFFKSAAEQGVSASQFSLGVMYSNGWGINQNLVYAHMWFNLSAMQGEEHADTNREKVAKYLTTQAVTQAQTIAKECLEKNYKNCVPFELNQYKKNN